MAKYRKRPVVIEAGKIIAIDEETASIDVGDGGSPDWIANAFAKGVDTGGIWVKDGEFRVGTLEGVMRAKCGDWLIKGIKGELYPIDSDIFEATYEPVS